MPTICPKCRLGKVILNEIDEFGRAMYKCLECREEYDYDKLRTEGIISRTKIKRS